MYSDTFVILNLIIFVIDQVFTGILPSILWFIIIIIKKYLDYCRNTSIDSKTHKVNYNSLHVF